MNIITTLLSNLNYPTIFFLMLLESTVVPVPSEFVVTPAAYHAASGSLNVFLIILFATLGADVGASINYFAALYVGRPVVYKFANSKLGQIYLGPHPSPPQLPCFFFLLFIILTGMLVLLQVPPLMVKNI